MIVAQISDTHLMPLKDGADSLANLRAHNLERCIEAINALEAPLAAVIHTGDMVNYEADNGYGLAREILAELKVPLFPVVGNRDHRAALIEAFLAPDILRPDAPFCQYRVSLGGLDLVAADTKSDERRVGTACCGRLAHLEALLEKDTQTPVCIFMHHPPVEMPVLKNPLQFVSLEEAEGFSALFDRYDNIRRIFCGHTHRSDMMRIGRHCASTLPSLATDVRLDRYPPHLRELPIFQVHELRADGTISSRSHVAGDQAPFEEIVEAAA
jgi:3',5'-cyclic AMP phosphodiesterase CpdA